MPPINHDDIYTFEELYRQLPPPRQGKPTYKLPYLGEITVQHLLSRVTFPEGEVWTLQKLKVTPFDTFKRKYGDWVHEKLKFSPTPSIDDYSVETIHTEIRKIFASSNDKLREAAFALKLPMNTFAAQLWKMGRYFKIESFFDELCKTSVEDMKYKLAPNYAIPWGQRNLGAKRKRSRTDTGSESVLVAGQSVQLPSLNLTEISETHFSELTLSRLDGIDIIKNSFIEGQKIVQDSLNKIMGVITEVHHLIPGERAISGMNIEADLFQPLSNQLERCRESCLFFSDVQFYENMLVAINLLKAMKDFLPISILEKIYKLHTKEVDNMLKVLRSELDARPLNAEQPVADVRLNLEKYIQELTFCLIKEATAPLSLDHSLMVWNLLLSAQKIIENIQTTSATPPLMSPWLPPVGSPFLQMLERPSSPFENSLKSLMDYSIFSQTLSWPVAQDSASSRSFCSMGGNVGEGAKTPVASESQLPQASASSSSSRRHDYYGEDDETVPPGLSPTNSMLY